MLFRCPLTFELPTSSSLSYQLLQVLVTKFLKEAVSYSARGSDRFLDEVGNSTPGLTYHRYYFQLTWPLQWRHSERNGVSNQRRPDCLLNRLFRRRSKEISKLRVTGLCEGIPRSPVDSPHKGPVTRKMFPFDDIVMVTHLHGEATSPNSVLRALSVIGAPVEMELHDVIRARKCATGSRKIGGAHRYSRYNNRILLLSKMSNDG